MNEKRNDKMKRTFLLNYTPDLYDFVERSLKDKKTTVHSFNTAEDMKIVLGRINVDVVILEDKFIEDNELLEGLSDNDISVIVISKSVVDNINKYHRQIIKSYIPKQTIRDVDLASAFDICLMEEEESE